MTGCFPFLVPVVPAAPAAARGEPAPQRAADRPLVCDRRGAARVLGVSAGTIDNLRLRGELPSIKIGSRRLYAVADLEQFINARRKVDQPAAVPAGAGR